MYLVNWVQGKSAFILKKTQKVQAVLVLIKMPPRAQHPEDFLQLLTWARVKVWGGADPCSWCFLQACRLLSDDYEQVRSAAVQMVWVLSQLYPERWSFQFKSTSCREKKQENAGFTPQSEVPLSSAVWLLLLSVQSASCPSHRPMRRSGWLMMRLERSVTWSVMVPGRFGCRPPKLW